MKTLFDAVSFQCSRDITKQYSTSFALAVKLLSPKIRQDIYNIYGFVRCADEIVDSFQDYNKEELFSLLEGQLTAALEHKISINPILNAFQNTYHTYNIPFELVEAFMKSMKQDLYKKDYHTFDEYKEYIYGSADVVGLMCLKVFVKGDDDLYNELKNSAMRLGSAFQKVNFLRDLKADSEVLERSYFPNIDLNNLNDYTKQEIIEEIEDDFKEALLGIKKLPIEAKFGVYTAYIYYRKLLIKLKQTPAFNIKNTRIRVPDYQKFGLLAKSYVNYRMNLI